MGRLEINTSVTLDADDDILDSLEDVDSALMIDVDVDAQPAEPGILAKNRSYKNMRRRLEDKLEDMKLKRQITDYNFSLH